jgi:thiosulfate/3-mercaptopyruvate sulfurtransferase
MAPKHTLTVRLPRRAILTGILAAPLLAGCRSKDENETIGPLVSADALAARLDDVKSGKIAVFYVGPDALFGRGHVPGARNVGEVSTEPGRRALIDALAKLPPETEIVVYCGCCPYKNCPNVRPASAVIREAGRTNARVLDLPTRFATDWADKGYPVEKT